MIFIVVNGQKFNWFGHKGPDIQIPKGGIIILNRFPTTVKNLRLELYNMGYHLPAPSTAVNNLIKPLWA